ncbi:MAG: tRNA dihydrouridine synthase DusB [Pseudomonadota bacterium]
MDERPLPARDNALAAEPLRIGPVTVPNRVFLAPMSGITDLPFRKLAQKLGAGLVVTEMVASHSLVNQRDEEMRRVEKGDERPFVVQLSGREAHWMAEGARIAEARGADIIDINMGCPAKQVTRGLSGSALMRDLDHALELIDATVAAVNVPVTLKMRMGWDHDSLNAPELAARAEQAGVRMITVHGRTRCQFFKGTADWRFVSRVKDAVNIPVIVNGDVQSMSDIRSAMTRSGADGVMIGRGCYGRPWFPGAAVAALKAGTPTTEPLPPEAERDIVLEHYEAMLAHYGREFGARNARKHLGWHVERRARSADEQKHWRARLCRAECPREVRHAIGEFFDSRVLEAA